MEVVKSLEVGATLCWTVANRSGRSSIDNHHIDFTDDILVLVKSRLAY